MKKKLNIFYYIMILGFCAVVSADFKAPLHSYANILKTKKNVQVVGAKAEYSTKPLYKKLKPINKRFLEIPPLDKPVMYNPVSEVIKLNEQRIADMVYGVYMLENLRGKDSKGQPCPLYATQDRLFVGTILNKTIFAVCDGHGKQGDVIAQRVAKTVPLTILNTPGKGDCFTNACKSMQENLTRASEAQRSGTTFVGAVIDKNVLRVGHVGDSRLIVVRPASAKILLATQDHKALYGGPLAISRALGDIDCYKKGLTTCKPDIAQCVLKMDDIIIMASDGYWDVVDNESTARFIFNQYKQGNFDCKKVAQFLAEHARSLKSKDDISVIVVRYGDATNYHGTQGA